MDAVGIELADLDGLSVANLKMLLCEKHAALQEQHVQLLSHREQLIAKDAQLLDYTIEIESLKLLIRKLRHMQFGKSSESAARSISSSCSYWSRISRQPLRSARASWTN